MPPAYATVVKPLFDKYVDQEVSAAEVGSLKTRNSATKLISNTTGYRYLKKFDLFSYTYIMLLYKKI